MVKTAETVTMDVSLREKIALAIMTSYYQAFLDYQSKDDILLGEKSIQEKFIKEFLGCKDTAACCEVLGISPAVLEAYLTSLKNPADPEAGSLSLIVIKKQFGGMLGPTLRPNMKANLERFISDFVKESRNLGFEADEITDFLVEIFHELGYADVSIPDPKPQFRFPLPIPGQVF